MTTIKSKGFILRIDDDFVDIEVYYNGTWWYYLEEYLTDDMVDLIDEWRYGGITLLTFVNTFFEDVKFSDEEDKETPHEFNLEEWRQIL